MTAPVTRVSRRSSQEIRALEIPLTPLIPVGDWYELAAKKAFIDFEGDVVAAIVEGKVMR